MTDLTLCTLVKGQSVDPKEYYHPSREVHNLPDMAEDAKAHGVKAILVPPPASTYPQLPALDELFSQYATALIRIRDIRSYYDNEYRTEITSDLVVDVVEVLFRPCERGITDCSSSTLESPSTITITIPGGVLLDNGVRVIQRSVYPTMARGAEFVAVLAERHENGKEQFYFACAANCLIAIKDRRSVERSQWIHSRRMREFLDDNGITSLSQLKERIQSERGKR